VADVLGSAKHPVNIFFFDNTDPDGFDRVFERIGNGIATTFVVVISKSGGKKETRNGMLEAQARFGKAGLAFEKHAVAVIGPGSELDQFAAEHNWLARFPGHDCVGPTPVMSAVGLVPAALLGFTIEDFLAAAATMDARTRAPEMRKNAAMLLALMWYHAGNGRGEKTW
jgi:glucose-6-phosphate isomerase